MTRILLFQLLGVNALNFTAMPWYGYPKMQLAIWVVGGAALFVASTHMLGEQILTERIAVLNTQIAECDAAIAKLNGATP